jgi:hypothetical protein
VESGAFVVELALAPGAEGLALTTLAEVSAVVRRTRDALGATAASLFLIDEARGELTGVLGDWDWTRTSFTARLADWPTVARALGEDDPQRMTAADARGSEAGWFESRGIVWSVFVPVRHQGRPLAVLFFDFAAGRDTPDRAAVASLVDVARRCALALDGSSVAEGPPAI